MGGRTSIVLYFNFFLHTKFREGERHTQNCKTAKLQKKKKFQIYRYIRFSSFIRYCHMLSFGFLEYNVMLYVISDD